MRLWLAIRAFCIVLFNSDIAAKVERVLSGDETEAATPVSTAEPPARQPAAQPSTVRNEALTLLATLQREARLVDIVKEPLGNYSDEQIGAAARDVLRDCGAVLDRLFGLQPVLEVEEGADVETPADFDGGRYRLIGNPVGEAPYRGRLVHHGWRAIRCELPHWSGSPESAMVVAPVELEVG